MTQNISVAFANIDRPMVLYKYRSIDKGDPNAKTPRVKYQYDRDIIESSRLWAGSPLQFNDPFDCLPILRMSLNKKDIIEWLVRQKLEEYPNSSSEDIEGAIIVGLTKVDDGTVERSLPLAWSSNLQNSGALSLTENVNDMRMWSFYADEHRGYCLEFNTARPPFCYAKKVIYNDKRPTFEVLSRGSEKEIECAYLAKAKCWESENEWRIIRYKTCGPLQYQAQSLTGIIFGARMPDGDKAALTAMVEQGGNMITIKQASLDSESYRII